ncbi:hypothetical protein [Kribbella sp. CA-247076]|uniref:hypothetical protein n=1 Tax=Kribbella sp. CA-247076 TaxID=3239941 RepID=UPI003D9379E2
MTGGRLLAGAGGSGKGAIAAAGVGGIIIAVGVLINGILHNDAWDGESGEAVDPHGIEDETGFSPEELGQLVEGHVPEDRFGEKKPGELAKEIQEVLQDPAAPVKPGNAGPWVRDEKRNRTIMLNKNQPWRSTAVTESKGRWEQR